MPHQTLEFRLATAQDALEIRRIYAPFIEGNHVSFEAEVPSEAEIVSRIEASLKTHAWIVCMCEGALAGYAYATPHRSRAAYQWVCEASIYLDPMFHGRRIGQALYGRLFELLRVQGYMRVLAGIALPNDQSMGFHAAQGFEPVGVYQRVGYKMGQWWDVCWMQKDLGEKDAAPNAIRTLEEMGLEEVNAVLKGSE